MKKLIDLNPEWVGAGGPGISQRDPTTGELVPVPERRGVGVMFDCPCGCVERCYVPFSNPVDGGPTYRDEGHAGWQRTGDTFETLTLAPSIHRVRGCGWHGFINNGNVTTV